jgi:hypothetical protein
VGKRPFACSFVISEVGKRPFACSFVINEVGKRLFACSVEIQECLYRIHSVLSGKREGKAGANAFVREMISVNHDNHDNLCSIISCPYTRKDCFGQARAMTRFFSIDLIVEITADVVVETWHALSLCIIFYPLKNVSSCRFCSDVGSVQIIIITTICVLSCFVGSLPAAATL